MAVNSVGLAGTGISLQQIEGQVAGLDKLASAVAGMFSPTGKIVDSVGSALNLPDPIKQIAKIALGVGTGDILGIISGAFGLAGDLMEEVAKTQYHPPADPMQAGGGYARPFPEPGCSQPPPPSPSPCPPPPCGRPPVDPELLREKRALEVLTRDFGAIDNAGGFWFPDGRFSGLDMAAVARGDFPPEMKEAVRYLQQHPEKFCRMDRSDGFDGLVGRGALQQELCRVNAEVARQQGAHPGGGGAPVPGPCPSPSPSPMPGPCGSSVEDRMMSSLGAAENEVKALQEQALEHPDDKKLQLKLQEAMEKVRALFEMLSSMLKNNHEMRMSALQKI